MSKRPPRPRGPVLIAEDGETLGEFGTWYDPSTWFDGTAINWQPSPKYPDMDFVVVDTGTPMPTTGSDAVAAWSVDSPTAGKTTWYRVSGRAFDAGQRQAAIDTVVATAQNAGEAIAKTGNGIINAVDTITSNIVPILIGLAALWFLANSKGAEE